jgi:hypothetical protein
LGRWIIFLKLTVWVPVNISTVAHLEHKGHFCSIGGLINVRANAWLFTPRTPDTGHVVIHVTAAAKWNYKPSAEENKKRSASYKNWFGSGE